MVFGAEPLASIDRASFSMSRCVTLRVRNAQRLVAGGFGRPADVICGGGSRRPGIGNARAAAILLARHGARVAALDAEPAWRNRGRGRAHAFRADLTSRWPRWRTRSPGSSALSLRGSIRMPAMPVTALLIGVRDSQDHRLIERVPDKLQADGKPVLVGAAGQ